MYYGSREEEYEQRRAWRNHRRKVARYGSNMLRRSLSREPAPKTHPKLRGDSCSTQ